MKLANGIEKLRIEASKTSIFEFIHSEKIHYDLDLDFQKIGCNSIRNGIAFSVPFFHVISRWYSTVVTGVQSTGHFHQTPPVQNTHSFI